MAHIKEESTLGTVCLNCSTLCFLQGLKLTLLTKLLLIDINCSPYNFRTISVIATFTSNERANSPTTDGAFKLLFDYRKGFQLLTHPIKISKRKHGFLPFWLDYIFT